MEATHVIVGNIFPTGHELFWVDALTASASAALVNHSYHLLYEHAKQDTQKQYIERNIQPII